MRLDPETRQRGMLPLLAVVLVAVYLFMFLPLDRKAASLDVAAGDNPGGSWPPRSARQTPSNWIL